MRNYTIKNVFISIYAVYIYIVGHKILQLTERCGREGFFVFVSNNIQNTTVIVLGKKSLIVINKQTIATNTSMIRHAIFVSWNFRNISFYMISLNCYVRCTVDYWSLNCGYFLCRSWIWFSIVKSKERNKNGNYLEDVNVLCGANTEIGSGINFEKGLSLFIMDPLLISLFAFVERFSSSRTKLL